MYRAQHPDQVVAARKRYREQRRAAQARYRARHRDRVAAAKKLYRARNAEKVAAAKLLYRESNREKYLESQRRYYHTHREERLAYNRERNQTEHRRGWVKQYRAKKREAALAKKEREKRRTLEKIKSLGPLKLTIELDDCLKSVDTPVETYLETFCKSLEVRPQFSFRELLEESYTLTDLDSGERRPEDPPDWDQWLDDLLKDVSTDSDLSSSSFCDLSSDDVSSLCDLLPDEWAQPKEEDFDLDDFVS